MSESADDLPRDQPVGQIGPQAWIDEAKPVMAALMADGSEARFCGGCVRDSLYHRQVKDVDIATPDRPEQVMDLLKRAGIRAIPTGLEHGTVTAVHDGRNYEITTLRIDVESFGRHARVAFTDDWIADAHRRDFTINALYCRVNGDILDPTLHGIPDVGAGRVRFVGEAAERIDEDALRILRYFRFQAYYGKRGPDAVALAACRAKADLLQNLSGERVRNELMRILACDDPAGILILMQADRILAQILPEATQFGKLRLLAFLETRGVVRPGVGNDPLRRLASVLPADVAQVEAVAERWRLSNSEKERLVTLAVPSRAPEAGIEPKEARRLLHVLGVDLYRDLTLLQWAAHKSSDDHLHATPNQKWIELLDEADRWTPKPLPVQGADVLAAGIPSGPRVGALLSDLEKWWQDTDFLATREGALAKLAELIEQGKRNG